MYLTKEIGIYGEYNQEKIGHENAIAISSDGNIVIGSIESGNGTGYKQSFLRVSISILSKTADFNNINNSLGWSVDINDLGMKNI